MREFDLADAGLPPPPERRVLGPEPGLDERAPFSADASARTALGFAAYAETRQDRQREAARRAQKALRLVEQTLYDALRDVRAVRKSLSKAWSKELDK